MGLPDIAVATEDVKVPGGTVTVRGLYWNEQAKIAQVVDEDEQEANFLALAAGMDAHIDAVRAWCEKAPAATVRPLLAAILRLSGLGDVDGRPTQSPSPES